MRKHKVNTRRAVHVQSWQFFAAPRATRGIPAKFAPVSSEPSLPTHTRSPMPARPPARPRDTRLPTHPQPHSHLRLSCPSLSRPSASLTGGDGGGDASGGGKDGGGGRVSGS